MKQMMKKYLYMACLLYTSQEELLRFAYKLTANREEANDLLQETSLKALDNEDKFMPDTNFKGWMYTIMRNIFINNYRKIVRDQTYVDQTDNLFHLNPVSYTHLYPSGRIYRKRWPRFRSDLQNGVATDGYRHRRY